MRLLREHFGAILTMFVCLGTDVAAAAVYRCEQDGKRVYTDRPCAAHAAPAQLPPLGIIPSGDNADLAAEHDARSARERKVQDKADAHWLGDHEARKAEQRRFDAAIADGQAIKGMSADQVRRALGSPDQVERDGDSERWIYGSGKSKQTIVFADATVRSMKKTKRRK